MLADDAASDRPPTVELGEAKLALRHQRLRSPPILGPQGDVGAGEPMVDLAGVDLRDREPEPGVAQAVAGRPQQGRIALQRRNPLDQAGVCKASDERVGDRAPDLPAAGDVLDRDRSDAPDPGDDLSLSRYPLAISAHCRYGARAPK